MAQTPSTQPDILGAAKEKLQGELRVASLSQLLPVPCFAVVVGGLFWYSATWWRDPFVLSVMALFALAQLAAQVQFKGLASRIRGEMFLFDILKGSGPILNLPELKTRLAQPGWNSYLKDVVRHWLDLALNGDHAESGNIMANAARRRGHADQKGLRVHITLNRLTLKLGFIGTLIGLIITFPPMKQAMLSLQDFNGEMAFVHDIVKAIEADQYAIYATLVATGLSFVMELVAIQILTRLYGGFAVAESHLQDWNSTVLVPWAREHASPIPRDARDLGQVRTDMDAQVRDLHDSMRAGMESFMAASHATRQQMELLIHMQKSLGEGVKSLQEFEWEKHLQHLTQLEHFANKRAQDIQSYRHHLDSQAQRGLGADGRRGGSAGA